MASHSPGEFFSDTSAALEAEDTDSYRADFFCDNCSSDVILLIPKGTSVEDYLKDESAECPNCGVMLKLENRKEPDGHIRRGKPRRLMS
jgi:DNA-directed RNA polymerase subunit RPC12/RpoP